MKVLVIGAHGNTGMRVVKLLTTGQHQPLAMVRNAEQRKKFDKLGVATVLGDLEYPIDHATSGCDAVIFAAGSGSKTGKDKTVLIDHIGALRAMVSAATMGARRFILLSSIGAEVDSESPIKHYHRAKGYADVFLQNMSEVMEHKLDWTIVKPGRLTDEPGPGGVSVQTPSGEKPNTSRTTLAIALASCLDEPATIGKSFYLFDGEAPLTESLRSLG